MTTSRPSPERRLGERTTTPPWSVAVARRALAAPATSTVGGVASPRHVLAVLLTLLGIVLAAVLASSPAVADADADGPTVPATSAAPADATAYRPVGPLRVLDTRSLDARPAAGTTLDVRLPDHVELPTGTRGAALTVTATDPAGPGFVTVWGDGPRPRASTLNLDARDQTRSNAAIVPVATNGSVHLFVQAGAHLVVDLTGLFVESGSSAAGRLVTLGPTRLLDTRLDGRRLLAHETRTVDTTVVGVPRDAAAVSIELTAIATDGWFAAWPDGEAWPGTSVVHTDRRGAPITAPAIVPLRDGRLRITGSATGDVIIDVTGWFTGVGAPVSSDGLFVPIGPVRLADTRGGAEASPPLEAGGTLELHRFPFDVAVAQAVAINLTTVEPSGDGFVTAWPARAPRPTTSVANVERADVLAAGAVVPASAEGIALFSQPSAHLVVDVTGWFTTAARSLPPLPVPTPTGNTSYAFGLIRPDGRWARWDPCRPLVLAVDFTGAQAGARSAVRAAAEDLSHAMGVDVDVVEQDLDGTPIPETITLRWADAVDEPRFRDGVVGLGGFGATVERIVWGKVVIRSDVPLTVQPGGDDLLRFVVAHELAHAVGLAHVDDPTQLLYPYANGHDTFQAGDRSGLALVGTYSGCIAPRRIESAGPTTPVPLLVVDTLDTLHTLEG